MSWGSAWRDEGWIFTAEDGGGLHPDEISKKFSREVAASGLPRIRLHDLRHTAASTLLALGVPAKVVSERLGHANISITLDIYSHLAPGMDAEASELLARAYGTGGA